MIQPLNEILSQDDLTRLTEDTGLTAQEIAVQYEMAVKKAKAESAPKQAMNRWQRRKQEQQIKRTINSVHLDEASRPIPERFSEMDEEKQKDIYWRILERVQAENDKFAKMQEKNNDGEGID